MKHPIEKSGDESKAAFPGSSNSPNAQTSAHPVRQLQRYAGNQAMQQLLGGAANEARPLSTESSLAARIGATASSAGAPLTAHVRQRFEQHLHNDFSRVRVHTDPQADALSHELHARAFTSGNHVFFRQGEFHPDSSRGADLLAHELAHVAQQSPAQKRRPSGNQAPILQPHPAAERDASWAALAGGIPRVRLDALHLLTQHDDATTPASIINHYTGFWGLDQRALGQKLFDLAWMSPDHYQFVIDVIELVDWDNRDDVSEAFVNSSRDDNLDEFARTETGRAMLRRMKTELLGGFTSIPEMGAVVRLFNALKRWAGAEEGRTRGEAALDAASQRALQGTPQATPLQHIGPEDFGTRLRLIDGMLHHIRETGPRDDHDLDEALLFAAAGSNLLQVQPIVDADGAAAQIALAQRVIERADRSLGQLNFLLTQYSNDSVQAAAQPNYRALVERVRRRWLDALKNSFLEKAAEDLTIAEAESAALPRALTEVDLGILAHRESVLLSTHGSADLMIEWVEWVRSRLDALETEARALAESHRRNDPGLAPREAKFREQADLIQLSIEGIQDWEAAIRATEVLVGGANLIPGAYEDAATIRMRCQQMKAAALAGDLAALRAKIQALRSDPDIQRFYRAIPAYIGMSAMIAGLAILLVATVASAGVGGLVAAPEVAGIAAVAGELALESLTFTAVSRTLQSAVMDAPHTPFLLDFALNFCLFSLLRVTGTAIRGALVARGMPALVGLSVNTASFGILQGWGILQFRLEEGQWPSSDEIAKMSVQSLIMMVGVSFASGAVRRLIANQRRLAALESFGGRYGARVVAIEVARTHLADRVRTEIMAGRGDDQTMLGAFREEATRIEQLLQALVEEVQADREIGIEALRNALADKILQQADIGSQLLTASFDLPGQVGLRRAGGELQYTYEFGSTPALVERLQAIGAKVSQTTDASGLHTLTTSIEGQPAAYFVERPEAFRQRLAALAQTIEQPGATRAQRLEVLSQLRTVFEQPPGELEGYVLDTTLEENRRAFAELERELLRDNPDVIVGMESGGAFLADVVGGGDPALRSKVQHMPVHKTPAGEKFDIPAMVAEFVKLINLGARRIAIVDSYMGGTTASALRDVLMRVAKTYPDVQIDVHWMRENFGFEKRSADGSIVREPRRGDPSEGKAGASQIHPSSQELRIVLGDDMTIVYDPESHEPITIFDRNGRVTSVIYPRPGQNTRQLLIEILNRRSGP